MLLSNRISIGCTCGRSLDEKEIPFDGMGVIDVRADWLRSEHGDHRAYCTFYVVLELSLRVFIRQLHLGHGLHYSFPYIILHQGDWQLHICGSQCEYGHVLRSISRFS